MIIGLSVESIDVDRSISLPLQPASGRLPRVSYERTVRVLKENADTLTAVFVPESMKNVAYEYMRLVEHIRIDEDTRIARIPILVCNPDEAILRQLDPISPFQRRKLESIGVGLGISQAADEINRSIDNEVFEEFRALVGAEPRYDKGRHDQSNRWGAYVALRAMRMVAHNNSPIVDGLDARIEAVELALFEDPFYKRKGQAFNLTPPDQRLVVDARREWDALKKHLNGNTDFLAVEDQLDDGWRGVFEYLVGPELATTSLQLITTTDEAKKKLQSKQVNLIFLDVRLDADRNRVCQGEASQEVSELSGVRLARWIRGNRIRTPIISVTASNKAWTLEALLGYGVNAYWVKDSPETTLNLDQAIRNFESLCSKSRSVLAWSDRTGSWVSGLHKLADLVLEADQVNGGRLREKALSLEALLFQSVGPFNREYREGLQFNVAFLIVYSCMNDLVEAICLKEYDHQGDTITWKIQDDLAGDPVLVRRPALAGRADRAYEYVMNRGHNDRPQANFPDVSVAREIMIRYSLMRDAKKFGDLSDTRNGLPLIHGRTIAESSSSKPVRQVEDGQISELISIMHRLIQRHRGQDS